MLNIPERNPDARFENTDVSTAFSARLPVKREVLITDVIKIEDLKEPYDRLAEFLTLAEIIGVEHTLGGRQIKFKRTCEDVKTEYPELAALLGTKKAEQVAKTLSGMWIYFPELKRNCKERIKGLIIAECNGYNYLELAKTYGYTERHIKSIVAGKVKRRAPVDENQISMFDEAAP